MSALHRGKTYDHCLNAVKGWFSDGAKDLDCLAQADGGNTLNLTGGRVVHLTATGKFALGATGTKMPMFLFSSYTDTDVAEQGINPNTGQHDWYSVRPRGYYTALVATGAYELESTEYNTGDEFPPNTPLHAPTEAQLAGSDDLAKAGMLFARKSWEGGDNSAFTVYEDHICGIVSWGVGKYDNSGSPNMVPNANTQLRSYTTLSLRFWPVFFPGVGAA